MSDELEHYFHCVETYDHWHFQVATVNWPHPHKPELAWVTFRRWKTVPDPARLQKARTAALANPRFFRTCSRCHELKNAGHMHDQQTCQSCAERYLGVVH